MRNLILFKTENIEKMIGIAWMHLLESEISSLIKINKKYERKIEYCWVIF